MNLTKLKLTPSTDLKNSRKGYFNKLFEVSKMKLQVYRKISRCDDTGKWESMIHIYIYIYISFLTVPSVN